MSTVWRIVGGTPLFGRASVPGDKSIAHRALILAAIAEGTSHIEGLPDGEDVKRTLAALRGLGVSIAVDGQVARVDGVGLDGLRAPASTIDCGNSGTTMRLMAGLLAGRGFEAVLDGDASLRLRPMRRVVEPLRRLGARIEATSAPDGELRAPLRVLGGRLGATDQGLPVASAQVKGALLLAGLRASGRTRVAEPMPSRDHTERLLARMGAPIGVEDGACFVDTARWAGRLTPLRLRIPGDLSSAALLCVGAVLLPGGDVSVTNVGANPTRTGFADVLRAMGAWVTWTTATDPEEVEPQGDLRVVAAPLVGADVRGELALRALDEIPVLCVAASQAVGPSTFGDVAELRRKESDRIAATSRLLRAMGARIDTRDDGLVVHGPTSLRGVLHPGDADLRNDHRVAMSVAVAALAARGESEILGVGARTSFPAFAETMIGLGAKLTTVNGPC